MQLQVKLQKTADITYLKGNKEQGRRCIAYHKIRMKKKATINVLNGKTQHET